MHKELPLVVGRSAGIDLSILDDRVERSAIPEFEGVGRLNVVMAIDEDGGSFGVNDLFAVHHGMAVGGVDFRFVDAGLEEVLADGSGAGLHVGFVFAAGADGGDAEEVEEFV
jgi:hypothetical protein